jgi:hypothetical protein
MRSLLLLEGATLCPYARRVVGPRETEQRPACARMPESSDAVASLAVWLVTGPEREKVRK